MASHYRVAVLAGGDSAERAVSLESGAAVTDAIAQAGHVAVQLDPSATSLASIAWSDFDVAFLALHGTWGEDGQVQAILEGLGVPYTGSDAAASKLAFHKSAAKERFAHSGVPTPASVLIHESDDAAHIQRQARKLGYPLVVKPDAQGSSLGISLVDSADELPEALSRCFHFGPFGLLETMIVGTEWTVGLIDDIVLPPIQIVTPRSFYDYDAKYHDDQTEYIFHSVGACVDSGNGERSVGLSPRYIPDATLRAIQEVGEAAAEAVGTSGPARVDLRVDALGQPWVLEINTIPGMTSHSLIPKAAARAGISFAALCERAIESALRRAAESATAGSAVRSRPIECPVRRVG